MFYTYVNNQKNRRREIGPLKNSKGELVYDGVEICNTLKDEYTKEFSERDENGSERLFDEHSGEDLHDIENRVKRHFGVGAKFYPKVAIRCDYQ